MVQKSEDKTAQGVDALEKLAYLIAEEFVAESKRELTRELLENRPAPYNSSERPRVRHAGGNS